MNDPTARVVHDFMELSGKFGSILLESLAVPGAEVHVTVAVGLVELRVHIGGIELAKSSLVMATGEAVL